MKNIYFFFLVFTLLTSSVFAQTTTVWNPAGNPSSTGLWTEAANWTEGNVPEGDFKVVFNVPGAANCVLDTTHSIKQLVMGDGDEGGTLIIADSGHLVTGQVWSGIGWSHEAKLIVEKGGTVTFGEHMWVGWDGEATVEIMGTVNVTAMYGTAFEGQSGKGFTTVKDSGVLNLANLHPENSIPDGSYLDVTNGGTIKIAGDKMDIVQNYIDLGRITANNGANDPVLTLSTTESDTATVITIPKTTYGITGHKISDLSIYPNPASEVIFLKDNTVGDIKIYNIVGNLVISEEKVSKVDIRALKAGSYIVVVSINENFQVGKLIIN